MNIIQGNCENLSTGHFLESKRFVKYAGEQRYTSFLCSFGHQLIRANVDGIGAEKLLEETEKCVKLVCNGARTSYKNVDDAKRISISSLIIITLQNIVICSNLVTLAQSINLRQLGVQQTIVLPFC